MDTVINVFAAIGVAIVALVVWAVIDNFINSFKRWRKERKKLKARAKRSYGRIIDIYQNEDGHFVVVKCSTTDEYCDLVGLITGGK